MNIVEPEATVEWLPVSAIHWDEGYQRNLSVIKVREIAAHYDEQAAGFLFVNLRQSGEYFGMDGHHRHGAQVKKGIVMVRCEVVRGLTPQAEAALFIKRNQNRKNPAALDIFKARLFIGEPIAVAIETIIKKHGLSIDFTCSTGGHHKRPVGVVYAVEVLEWIYLKGGEELLDTVLTLALRCFPNEGSALEWAVLRGLANFHLKYKGRYSREGLIYKAGLDGILTLLRRAKAHAEIMGGAVHIAFMVVLQECYDKGRRGNRLEKDKA